VCVLQLTGSQADLVAAAASSGNLQALNSMSTGNLTGLGSNGSLSQSQVWPCLLPVRTTVYTSPVTYSLDFILLLFMAILLLCLCHPLCSAMRHGCC